MRVKRRRKKDIERGKEGDNAKKQKEREGGRGRGRGRGIEVGIDRRRKDWRDDERRVARSASAPQATSH